MNRGPSGGNSLWGYDPSAAPANNAHHMPPSHQQQQQHQLLGTNILTPQQQQQHYGMQQPQQQMQQSPAPSFPQQRQAFEAQETHKLQDPLSVGAWGAAPQPSPVQQHMAVSATAAAAAATAAAAAAGRTLSDMQREQESLRVQQLHATQQQQAEALAATQREQQHSLQLQQQAELAARQQQGQQHLAGLLKGSTAQTGAGTPPAGMGVKAVLSSDWVATPASYALIQFS